MLVPAPRGVVVAWLLVAGCGPVVGSPPGGAETTGDGDSTTRGSDDPSLTTSTTTMPSTTTTVGPSDTGDGSDDGPVTTECPFICEHDVPESYECSLFDQDCPAGEKCMPWANDGGNAWNATRCSPLDPTPAGIGEPCTVEGSGVSGIDDCERAAMCWDVDPETMMGECVAFCMGSEANPVCEDPYTSCTINGEGTLILCLPMCDPLLQDCNEGEACYPNNDTFRCSPDASAEMGGYGDPCEFINVCDPGLFCANVDAVPGCAGSSGCCSEFCSLEAGDAQCSGAAQGQECVPWFEDDQAPPMFADVGACVVPQ